MIYTSYFAKLKSIDKSIIPVSICVIKPSFYNGLEYRLVAPTIDILMEYNNTGDVEKYNKRYKSEVLSNLKPDKVVSNLKFLSNNSSDIVLVCYEAPDKHCHRHLLADWLNEYNYNVREYI